MFKLIGDEKILEKDIWLKVAILAHNAMARKNDREIETHGMLLMARKVAQAQMKQDARDMVKWMETRRVVGIGTPYMVYVCFDEKVWEALKKLAE